MPTKQLEVYLNDHLAGSTVAIEMIQRLRSANEGTSLGIFFQDLETKVSEDRDQLKELMTTWGISISTLRTTSAWLTEKLTALKLKLDDPADGHLRLLESLEMLSLGIEGKRSLWLAIAAAAQDPKLIGIDLPQLIRRAEEQRREVEKLRLESSRRIFGAE